VCSLTLVGREALGISSLFAGVQDIRALARWIAFSLGAFVEEAAWLVNRGDEKLRFRRSRGACVRVGLGGMVYDDIEARDGFLTIINGRRRKRGLQGGFSAASDGLGERVLLPSKVEVGVLGANISLSPVTSPRPLELRAEGITAGKKDSLGDESPSAKELESDRE